MHVSIRTEIASCLSARAESHVVWGACVLPESFAWSSTACVGLINNQSSTRFLRKWRQLADEWIRGSESGLPIGRFNNNCGNFVGFQSLSSLLESLRLVSWVLEDGPSKSQWHAFMSELGHSESLSVIASSEAQDLAFSPNLHCIHDCVLGGVLATS